MDQLDLMETQGQKDSKDPMDLLDHLVIQLKDSSTEERRILTISRILKRCVCVCVCCEKEKRVGNGVCPLSIEWRLYAHILF